MAAKEPPASLMVLGGGGAVGLELAQVFARFGTRVTVLEALERLLPMEEPESCELIAEVLRADGFTVRTGVRATAVRHDGNSFTVSLGGGESAEEFTAQQLLVATGCRADLAALGVDTVGLDPQARALGVDEHLLAAPGLWAVADVTGHGAFTHVAMYQAEIAVRAILGEDGPGADYRALPRVTFTHPEVASVRLTEAQAREQGLPVLTGLARVPSSARGWIHKAGNEGLSKLVEDADRGVLVGATAAGPMGSEVMYGLAVAVQAEVPVDRLRHMIYAYRPSTAALRTPSPTLPPPADTMPTSRTAGRRIRKIPCGRVPSAA